MSRAITHDPREYRRGMVLGLTLAETLLLLLFILILTSAALIWRRDELLRGAQVQADAAREEAATLRPIAEAVQQSGALADSVDELVARLQRAEADARELERLRPELAAERERARQADARRSAAEQAVARLERDNLQLRQLVETPNAIAREVGRLRDELQRSQSAADQAVAANQRLQSELIDAQTERQRLADAVARAQAEQQRVIAEGMIAGGVFPSCWQRDSQPEFAFHVALQAGGRIIVEDRAPRERQQEEAWRLLEPFPRGVPIEVELFVNATRRMSEWSQRQSPACRFRISVRRDLPADAPTREYLRVIGPLGNAPRHIPFYRVGG